MQDRDSYNWKLIKIICGQSNGTISMILNNLKVTFADWNLSNFHTSKNVVCHNYDMFRPTRKSVAHVACSFNCLFQN